MALKEIAKLCANMSLLEREGPVQRLNERLKAAVAHRLTLSLVGKSGFWLSKRSEVHWGTWNRRVESDGGGMWSTVKQANSITLHALKDNNEVDNIRRNNDKIELVNDGEGDCSKGVNGVDRPGGLGIREYGSRRVIPFKSKKRMISRDLA
ncbi:hypothetical protein QYF36_017959 [Acer negundo]|nr:hypothetical protein QYF36_017959 [Acer negundo]